MSRARHLVNSVDYLRETATAGRAGPFTAGAVAEGPVMTWDRAAAIPRMPMPDRAAKRQWPT